MVHGMAKVRHPLSAARTADRPLPVAKAWLQPFQLLARPPALDVVFEVLAL